MYSWGVQLEVMRGLSAGKAGAAKDQWVGKWANEAGHWGGGVERPDGLARGRWGPSGQVDRGYRPSREWSGWWKAVVGQIGQ